MAHREKNPRERELLAKANRVLPGGSLGNLGPDIVIDRGMGSHVWDVSGNEYIDYLLGSGPMLVGHSHPEVIAVVADQLERGTTFFAVNEHAILLAEEIVRASSLPWVVLRLGGVLSTDPKAIPFSSDALYFESLLPTDGRLHSVDVRDVAWAFAAATTADVVGEILLIAGDDSHRRVQGEVGKALAESRGLKGGLVPGRKGDPNSDDDWFVTDWMDTARAQEALQFQHYSWQDMLEESRAQAGASRYVLPLLAPLVRALLKRRGAYWKQPGQYADPWGAVRRKLGDPSPDT